MNTYLYRETEKSRVNNLAPIIISFGLASVLFFYGFSSFQVLRTWLTSLSGLAIIWFYIWYRYNGNILIQLNILMALSFSFFNLIPSLYLSLRIPFFSRLDRWDLSDTYALVNVLTTLGTLSMLIGYELIKQNQYIVLQRSTNIILSKVQVNIILAIICVPAWLARSFLVVMGGYYRGFKDLGFLTGRWASVANLISSYGLLVPIILWLLSKRDHRWRLWAWIATIAEFTWVIPSGARIEIIQVALAVIFVVWWCNQRPPVTLTAILVLLTAMTMPIMGQYRLTIGRFSSQDRVSITATIAAYEAAQEKIEREVADSQLMYSIDESFRRFYDGSFFAYILKYYHQTYNFEYGETYIARLPFVLLPYFVFPDRPIMQTPLNNWFPHLIAVGHTPVTFLGEAYINFGHAAICVIPFLLGVILAIWDNLWLKYMDNVFFVAIYLLFCVKFFNATSMNLVSILGMMRNYILLLAVFYMIQHLLLRFSRLDHTNKASQSWSW